MSVQSGQRYGRLVVQRLDGTSTQGRTFTVVCDCGAERIVVGKYLTSGNSRSCGCATREAVISRNRANRKHGHTTEAVGKCSPTYATWRAMADRCSRPGCNGFQHYGARGITVCNQWRGSFENFLADMGERPEGMTLDRIDPDGNYEPSNCRWATPSEQRRNQRSQPTARATA